MTRETIGKILEAEGIKMSAGGAAVAEDRELTCFIAARAEVMSVARVVRVELADKHVTLETARKERYHFAHEDVLGFRAMAPGVGGDRGAGFGR